MDLESGVFLVIFGRLVLDDKAVLHTPFLYHLPRYATS